MTRSKKLLSLVLSLVMMISVLTALPFTASAWAVSRTFDLGRTITAELNVTAESDSATTEFTIEGTGDMDNFEVDDTPIYNSGLAHYITKVTVPEGVTTVGDCVFYGLNNLESVSLPKSLRKIGDSAFQSCEKLKSITVPYKVESIGEFAFNYCEGLTSIVLPKRLTRIETGAFYGCDNLKTIYYAGSKADWEDMYKDDTDNDPLFNATVVYNYHVRTGTPTLTKRASFTQSGNLKYACALCDANVNVQIPMLGSVYAKPNAYIYDGKYKKPGVVVKDVKGNVIPSKYYSLSYIQNRNIGTAYVKVTFKGNYEGTKTVSFFIVPRGTKITKLSSVKKGFTVRWKKQASNTNGYQIQYSLRSDFKGAKTVTVKNKKATAKTVKNLQKGKVYYVRVRTYKQLSGKKMCSPWSTTWKVKTK